MSVPVVLITGAAGGLGQALSRALTDAGWTVVATDLKPPPAGHALDVTDAAACHRVVEAAVETHGGLDMVIANAGITHRSLAANTAPEVLRKVMDVNYWGAVNIVAAALPALQASAGRIGVVSSVAGYAGVLGRSGYAASKHALHGYFDSLRAELVPAGISVTMVCPSFIDTAIAKNALGGDGQAAQTPRGTSGGLLDAEAVAQRAVAAMLARKPLQRIGATAHLAWWLSRLAPQAYMRQMRKRLAKEFDS